MKVFNQQATENFFDNFCKGTGEPVLGIMAGENGNLLKVLKWLKHYDEYYAIVDIKKNEIAWDFGIFSQLGYSKNEIKEGGILFLRKLIHPFVRDWHNLFTTQAIQLFKKGEPGWESMRSPRYIINIPVRKKNGNYVFVKQMLFPFQRDVNNNLVSYMNTFTVVDEYRGQPLRPRFFLKSKRHEDWERTIKEHASKIIDLENGENFTEVEFRFINHFLHLHHKATETTSGHKLKSSWKNKIAREMDIAVSTTGVHQANIFAKMKALFLIPYEKHAESIGSDTYKQCLLPFSNFESSVIFLQKSGILSVLKYSFLHTQKHNISFQKSFVISNF